jgi:hypothetical protein
MVQRPLCTKCMVSAIIYTEISHMCGVRRVRFSYITSFASAGTTAVSTSAIDPIVGVDGRRGMSRGQGAVGKYLAASRDFALRSRSHA